MIWLERGRIAEAADDPPDPPPPPPPGGYPVGMPLGIEVPNVGPSAVHVANLPGPKAYGTFGPQVESVIADSPGSDDGANVLMVSVRSPGVVFTRSMIGVVIVSGEALLPGNEPKFLFCDIGHRTVTTDLVNARSVGSGSTLVTFPKPLLIESAIKNTGRVYAYRCNMFGPTDTCNSYPTSRLTKLEECWCHSHTWLPSDPNLGGNPSHMDWMKAQGGCNLIGLNNRIDMYPALVGETRGPAPYYRSPHWGAALGPDWPARIGATNYVATGGWNMTQSGGPITNALIDGNVWTGPMQRWVYVLQRNPHGHVRNHVARNNRWNTPPTIREAAYNAAGTGAVNLTAADKHYWHNNLGPGGVAVGPFKTGTILTSPDFAAISETCR